jgi:cephalosporin-C deacetylase
MMEKSMFPHAFPFDPTYGYDLAHLLEVPSPEGPRDFEDFWRGTYEEARAVPLNLQSRQIASASTGHDLLEVEYDSLGGVRIGAWLAVPPDGKFERAVVCGHGYGGREGPEFPLPGPLTAAIFPCKRGFHRSAHPFIPGHSAGHVLHGIASRETYAHRGSVADIWGAASALIGLYPRAAERLHYQGASFGGGIGAMALPWDPRFERGFLDVPSFGNHPLRLGLPCNGSGEAVRLKYQRHPEILEVLRYFDAATAARHIRIPILAACALFDPAVPPPGQFAVFNALGGAKELFVRQAAHFEWPPGQQEEGERLFQALCRWFS